MQQFKLYIFRNTRDGIECEIHDSRKAGRHYISRHSLTDSTYDRFRALAGDPTYQFELLDASEGIAWQLWQDVPERRRCAECGQLALPKDAFCRYHRALADARIACVQ